MPLVDGLYQRRCKKSIGSPVFWFNFQRLRAIHPSDEPVGDDALLPGANIPSAIAGMKRPVTTPGMA